ncbi:MAG: proton-conducting transporter membrane subunit, partial [Planctomyces sp.]
SPVLCIAMLICVFSLVGLPPFGGFFAKLMIFAAAFKAGELHWFMYVVVAFGGLNTILGLFYYIRIMRTMFLEQRPADARKVPVRTMSLEGSYVMALAIFVLLLGILPGVMSGLSRTANAAAESVVHAATNR